MVENQKQIRSLILKLRVSPEEKQKMLAFLSKTTDRNLSNYLRKLGLQKPVTIRYRNESTDNFLHEMASLKKELSAISNNFNQAVHKLHTLDRIPEFREWIREQQQQHKLITRSIESIRLHISQLYEIWSQK
jgi:hypothetical protein